MLSGRERALLFTVCSAFAANWADHITEMHIRAVERSLEPGGLCGPEGECGSVLTSEWATLLGIPVSLPALPLYCMFTWYGIRAALGHMPAGRIASWAICCSLVAVGFSGWLLYHMLADIGVICRYCLVMDASALSVLVAAAGLHPDGPRAAFSGIRSSLRALTWFGPELWTVATVAGGTMLFASAYSSDRNQQMSTVEVAADENATNAIPAGQAEATGETRRIVLPREVVSIPIGKATRTRGMPNAPIVVAMFEDFQCPYCRKLSANLDALRQERPEQVRLAWFDFPMHSACNVAEIKKDLHVDACRAAVAGMCAHEQGWFWSMHDTMFQTNARLRADDLVGYAKRLELDVEAFEACMDNPATMAAVRHETTIAARLGVTGTPTFFVNGRRFSGAQSIEVLRAIVDAVARNPIGQVLLDVNLEGEILGNPGSVAASVEMRGPRGTFQIDAFEASIVDGKAVSTPGVEPSRGVTWYEADAACRAAGRRLCTEDEWLTACTGSVPVDEDGDGIVSDDPIRGRYYPYGAWRQEKWCASARERDDARPLLTGNHPRCVTPEGVYDLEGVTKEWVGLSADRAGLKGGSYFSKESARCAYFRDDAPDTSDRANGFRCCSGPEPAELTNPP